MKKAQQGSFSVSSVLMGLLGAAPISQRTQPRPQGIKKKGPKVTKQERGGGGNFCPDARGTRESSADRPILIRGLATLNSSAPPSPNLDC